MPAKIEHPRFRAALCPYLLVGNRRLLVHLDVYGIPQSLQWPDPGAPDRLGWRDPFDEWPYWEEMAPAAVRARVPRFEYAGGGCDCLAEAVTVESGYLEDTNILEGRYLLPGGAEVSLVTFVTPGRDVWVRRFEARGRGKLVLPGEFFEKAVRGHASTHLGGVSFRGAFTARPRGAWVLAADPPLAPAPGGVQLPVAGAGAWTICLCAADDLQAAARLGEQALADGFEALRDETAAADRAWVARAREPVARHRLVRRHYRRWLLGNRLFTAGDGAMVCGARPFWAFAWPRDGAQQIVGYAAAGFADEARLVAKWHLDNTPASGIHEARYFSDRQPMLLDNRPRQGDNPGFLAWAAGAVCRLDWDRAWAESIAPGLYLLADHLVRDRDPENLLPPPGADHRETRVAQSIGIAVTAAGGLKGAAYIAGRLGDDERARRYLARAEEIRQAAETHLWHRDGYFMTSVKPALERPDIAACWGAWPLRVWAADDPKITSAVQRLVRDLWRPEAGGTLSGAGTPYESCWMYHACTLLLGVAGIGDRAREEEILDALERNIPPQGLVPEQIGRTGALWGCAPLATAHAALLVYAYGGG